jgi:hypothetical protein
LIPHAIRSWAQDFDSPAGILKFNDGDIVKDLVVHVKPEEIPENDENFRIKLSLLKGRARLDEVGTTTDILILKNDSPVRFEKATVEVEEPDGSNAQQHTVRVFRGLDEDGLQPMGPSAGTIRVAYTFEGVSAGSGADFDGQNGIIEFGEGENRKDITFR